MKTLVAIPCYHCANQIARVIASTKEIQKETDFIVIENSGGDDTLAQAVQASSAVFHCGVNIQVFRNKRNYGLGGSFKIAVKYARENNYDIMFWFHGDAQAEVHDLSRMMQLNNNEKYDVIFGARFMPGANRVGYSRIRLWGNLFFNLLASLILRFRVHEVGSGLNMYTIESLPSNEELGRWVNNIAFDINLLRHYRDKRVLFTPIKWSQTDQKSTVSNLRVGFQVLSMLLFSKLGLSNKSEGIGETRRVFP